MVGHSTFNDKMNGHIPGTFRHNLIKNMARHAGKGNSMRPRPLVATGGIWYHPLVWSTVFACSFQLKGTNQTKQQLNIQAASLLPMNYILYLERNLSHMTVAKQPIYLSQRRLIIGLASQLPVQIGSDQRLWHWLSKSYESCEWQWKRVPFFRSLKHSNR